LSALILGKSFLMQFVAVMFAGMTMLAKTDCNIFSLSLEGQQLFY
jgi:hypothetical protein